MREALKEAVKSFENEEVPVGAVVVRDDTIIGRGCNRKEALNDPTAHAEIIAITAAEDKERKDQAFESGMNDFISKPLKVETIKKLLIKWFSETI